MGHLLKFDGKNWHFKEGGDLEAFLNREQERYRKQLEQYAALMRALDNRPLKLGLYFPLLKGWREWTE